MNHRRFLALVTFALHAIFVSPPATAIDVVGSNATVAEAKQLLDTYYGNTENLQKASELLNRALEVNPRNAHAYVQAARLTVMGGYIARSEFKSGTAEAYHALLDQALAIDADNQKAHILKAEAYDIQRDYPREKMSLDKAQGYGDDPWLWMGYGRYYGKIGDPTLAYHYYTKVEALGPGKSAEHRRAYISSLTQLARYTPVNAEPGRLKSLASKAWRERHPADAWTLGSFAEFFVSENMFEDASTYAREALRTMNYGAGRLILASSLYAHAAQLIVDNKARADSEKLIAEARTLGFHRAAIMARLQRSKADLEKLMPTLMAIVP